MGVTIQIRGRTYTLRSDAEPEELKALAAYVDRRMAELERAEFDDYTVALLAALNIAQDFHRHRQRVRGELVELAREVEAAGALVDAALPGSRRGGR